MGIQQIRDLSRVKKMGIEQIVDQRKTDLTMKTMGEGNRRLDLQRKKDGCWTNRRFEKL